jgi:Capsule assembly protein Wzi
MFRFFEAVKLDLRARAVPALGPQQDGACWASPRSFQILASVVGIGLLLCISSSVAQDRSGSEFKGSVSIPLDSWIYPVLDRLAALGYMPDGTAMVRPYTRLEAARLVGEAHEQYFEMDDVGPALLASLDREFAVETRILSGGANREARWESAYTRFTGIGGTPLRDGFHFSQTLVDDYGRPYGQGANNVTGLSSEAVVGPFAVYFRGEYQFASALPVSIYGAQAQQALVASDQLPFGWNLRFGNTSRLRPVEAYAALTLGRWQVAFGQQSLWWGPDRTTSLILSNNSAGLPMLRLSRVEPASLPGSLKFLGPVRFDFFMGREGGIHFLRLGPNFVPYGTENASVTPPPYMWGAHLTVKPTANLELGFAHTVIFAGYGRPLTFGTFIHTFSIGGNGQAVDPGKRVTEFNLAYHLPGFRSVIQVYSEGMAWDDPIEGKFVARYAWDPGIYISQLPKFHRLDARLEAAYTNLPKLGYEG